MATKKIAANLDLLTNQLQNFAIENVDARSAPAPAQAGRIVFDTIDHALYLNNGSQWVKLAEGTDATEAINALTLSLDGNKIKLSNGSEQDLSGILGFQTAKAEGTTINSSTQKTLTFKGASGISVSATTATGEITHKLSGLSFDTTSEPNKVILKAGSESLASFDSSSFVKDGMLKTVLGPYTATADGKWTVKVADGTSSKDIDFGVVKKGNTYIGFVWDTNVNDTSDAFTAMALDVTTLVNIYSTGDGLSLSDGKFSIKLGGQDEGYLAIDGNGYLVTSGINDKITASVKDAKDALDASIGDLDKRLDLAENNITGYAGGLAAHTTQIKDLTTKVTNVESAYAAGDRELLGDSSDSTDKNTIYGVRNYATNVARLMGGYNLSKLVTSGTTVKLYANPKVSETTNTAGLMIDLASISVRVGNTNTYELEVDVQKASDGTVTLSWSGVTPDTATNIFVVNYRVILTSTGA